MDLLVLPLVLRVETLELVVDLHAVHFAQHGSLSNLGPRFQRKNGRPFALLAFTERKRKEIIAIHQTPDYYGRMIKRNLLYFGIFSSEYFPKRRRKPMQNWLR